MIAQRQIIAKLWEFIIHSSTNCFKAPLLPLTAEAALLESASTCEFSIADCFILEHPALACNLSILQFHALSGYECSFFSYIALNYYLDMHNQIEVLPFCVQYVCILLSCELSLRFASHVL
jgi:hypothetical protein